MAESSLSFVGTYTDADEDGVFGFCMDESGALERTSAILAGADPTFLSPDPTGEHLYVANRPEGEGNVVAYEIDEDAGQLERLNDAPTRGNGTPCYCSVDATDQCVLTAQYGGGSITAIPLEQSGHLGDPAVVIQHQGSGVDPDRQAEPHPHCIRPGPDNNYVYVPDLGVDRVFIYEFDPAEPSLEPADCGHVDVQAGAGPRHIDFHPNGQLVYLINELDSTIVAFTRDATTGELTPIDTVSTLPPDFEGDNSTADIHVHPSGEFLYGSNRGHDSIAIYELDNDGRPTLLEIESTRGEWPRNFAIDPTGDFLFAENAHSDSIVVFRIASDGLLTPTGDTYEVPSPVCMRFVNE